MNTKTYNGYCVKCKAKRDFEGIVEMSRNGAPMAKGPCPECSTKICRILPRPKVA
jgi:Domain of unknown function (DUF5679)